MLSNAGKGTAKDPFVYKPAPGHLRIWTKNGDEMRNSHPVNAKKEADRGDFVPAGTYNDLSVFGFTSDVRTVTLYVEGIQPSDMIADQQIKIELDPNDKPTGPSFVCADAVRVTVIKVDLDVDSDNTNGFKPLTKTDGRTLKEDQIEDIKGDKDRPGKFITVNDNDTDHDFIPDFADGFNRDGASGTKDEKKDDVVPGEHFTPLVLELPAPIDLTKARIKITYNASDPKNVSITGKVPDLVYTPGGGTMRIWVKDGNQARKQASIAAQKPGDFVPSATTFDASQMGFKGTTRTKTFYIEGMAASSAVAASQIKVEVDPDGSGPADFVAVDVVRVTVIKIDLDATWNSNEATEEVPGTPVLLNNDWDGQKEYGASAPSGHREKEPIWDKDDTSGQVAAENDLMHVRIAVAPKDLKGNVKLKIASGSTNIRLWPRSTKGTANDIITIPGGGKTYAISSLPKDMYVEGLVLGRTVMTLDYTSGSATYSDKLNIDVVTIEESQGGTRKVINAYNSSIDFKVKPATLSTKYTYRWDLNGDGSRKNGAWENATNRTSAVKYSSVASGAGNVQLASNAANRRKEYNLSVKLKGGKLKGGLVVHKRIRVALDQYRGTAMPAQSTAGLHTVFTWSNTNPVKFDPLPPGDPHNGANRISYSLNLSPTTEASTSFLGHGKTTKVEYTEVGPLSWNDSYDKEILISIVGHETIHLHQLVSLRDDPNSIWRKLDNHYGSVPPYATFLEAEAYDSYLISTTVDWLFLTRSGKFELFRNNYNNSLAQLAGLPAVTHAKAKSFLQTLYSQIPFIEMKRSGYDWYTRAPR